MVQNFLANLLSLAHDVGITTVATHGYRFFFSEETPLVRDSARLIDRRRPTESRG
jgi:hypothetical protein